LYCSCVEVKSDLTPPPKSQSRKRFWCGAGGRIVRRSPLGAPAPKPAEGGFFHEKTLLSTIHQYTNLLESNYESRKISQSKHSLHASFHLVGSILRYAIHISLIEMPLLIEAESGDKRASSPATVFCWKRLARLVASVSRTSLEKEPHRLLVNSILADTTMKTTQPPCGDHHAQRQGACGRSADGRRLHVRVSHHSVSTAR